jgi:hypothetical protein
MGSKPTDIASLETKSLEDLRILARTAGLRGYSGLRKKQLIELLTNYKDVPGREAPGKTTPSTNVRAAKPKKPAKSKSAHAPATPAPAGSGDFGAASVARPTNASAEERIEFSKYEMTPPGVMLTQAFASTLYEDIEQLPALGTPVLCLLPQKPGVVHAYWTLQPGAETGHLRLRLCNAKEGSIEVLDEIKVPGDRGHWYFHVPQTPEAGELFAHLGYYDARGAFVTAIQRGIARIPTLYASNQTDRSWWISDEDFRAMYLRAGGTVRAQRLYWGGASASSPMNAPSSRQK